MSDVVHVLIIIFSKVALVMTLLTNDAILKIIFQILKTQSQKMDPVVVFLAIQSNDKASLGGGMFIYIKHNLCCYCRTDLEPENSESLWLEFKVCYSKPMLLFYSYRPPSSKVEWLNSVSESLDKSFNENKETVILGDFNFDLLKLCHNSKSLLQLMESMNFTQLVKCPTRITKYLSTLIDHIFTNIPGNIIERNIPSQLP